MTFRPILAAFLLGLSATHADPLLSPEEARAKMTVPEGFSVDLIAAEPDIVQPIAFCWDARGRIWVVEGMTYPTRRGKPVAGDSTKPGEAQLKGHPRRGRPHPDFRGRGRGREIRDPEGLRGAFESRLRH